MGSWRQLTGLVTLALALIAPASALALPDEPDTAAWVTNGPVWAIAHKGDTTYIGGRFHYVGPRVGRAVTLAKSDASVQSFPEFAGGTVEAAESDGAGGWYVGGAFTHVGGAPHARLVHVLTDGSVDPAFTPAPDGSVESLAFDGANHRLYVGGDFTHIGGQARGHLARILTTTNAVDSWDPSVFPAIGAHVRAIELHPSQSTQPLVWVGGFFDHVNDETAPNARTNFAEISTDTGALTAYYATNGPNFGVSDIEFEGDIIYIAGGFTTAFGSTRHSVAALNFSVPGLNAWDPNVTNTAGSASVNDIEVGTPGVVWVAGNFDTVGADTRRNFAAIFDVPSTLSTATAWNPDPSGSVSSFSTDGRSIGTDGTTVYVGGNFSTIAGQPRNGLAAFAADTGAITGWDGNVSDDTEVIKVAGSSVFAGGRFQAAKGVLRSSLAALDSSGVATGWNPGVGLGESVNALAAAPGDGPIYVGGDYTTLGGQPRASIGAVDAAGNVTGWHPDSTGEIRALALSPDGQTIYAGGNYAQIGGAARESLAALSASSNSALPWDPHPNSNVNALLMRPDGQRLYAGGDFDNFAGGTIARNHLAEFDPASATPTAFNPGPDSSVLSLALSADANTLFFGGTFGAVGSATRRYLAAATIANNAVTDFNPDPNDEVSSLALAEDGKTIFAGGRFDTSQPIGGATRDSLAELDVATGAATSWNPDADSSIHALLRVGPDLLAGGEQGRIGARAFSGFARFIAPRPPVVPISGDQPGPIPATPSAPPPDKTAPLLSALSLTNKLFAVGPKPTALTAAKRRVKKGTKFRWTLSEAATTRIQIKLERKGIKKGRRCVAAKPGQKVPRKKRCVALQSKGTLRRAGKQGRNSLAFSGRMGKRALKPGSYRAVFTATDAAGNRSLAKTLKFRIVRAPRR